MTKYYVSGTGSNKSTGLSQESAFLTLQKAADLVKAGDTVYVMNGTYTSPNTNILNLVNKNGSPDAPITFMAYPGDKPVIQAGTNNWNAISITGSSYVTIQGLTLLGSRDKTSLSYALSEKTNLNNPATSGSGINISYIDGETKDRSHHIIIDGNTISKFPGGGITGIQVDYVTIKNNTVSGNSWFSPFGTQGISFLNLWDSDNNTKDYKIIVENNTVFDNKQLVPWVSAGKITEGHGIMIDRAYIGSDLYTGKILIEDNLVYKNGGAGIQAFRADNPIDVLHNTVYKNSQVIPSGEIFMNRTTDADIENNIVFGKGGLPLVPIVSGKESTAENNLLYNGTTKNETNDNITGLNPLFTNAPAGDFSLKPNSPALIDNTQLGIY